MTDDQGTATIGIQVTRMLTEARDGAWAGNRIALAAHAFQTRVEVEVVRPLVEQRDYAIDVAHWLQAEALWMHDTARDALTDALADLAEMRRLRDNHRGQVLAKAQDVNLLQWLLAEARWQRDVATQEHMRELIAERDVYRQRGIDAAERLTMNMVDLTKQFDGQAWELAELRARLARAEVRPDLLTMEDTFTGCTDINPDVCACGDPGQPKCDACAEEIEPGQQYYMLHAPSFPWLADDHPDQELSPTWWHMTCDGRGVATQPAEPASEAPTLAETRTGTDWCTGCCTEVGTNRYGGDEDKPTERCASCGTALVPLPIAGVDYKPGCTNPQLIEAAQ